MKISVSIPTYNQGQYIEKAILSVYTQTLKPFEIIVSNDCSTDDTKDILEKLKLKIPILKVINQPVNLGIGKNVDASLKAATGDFILRLDSDDYLEPNYCQVLSALLVEFPEAGYAHGNVSEMDQHDNHLRYRTLLRRTGFQSPDDALRAAVKGYRVAANIVMFRRSALVAVDYMAGRPNFGEDYHLAVDLAAHGWGNVFSSKILSNYRVWVDIGKARQKRKLNEIVGLTSVFKDVIIPAFTKRKWDLKSVESSMEKIACAQSDCLGWDLYNTEEVTQLTTAILNLSSSTTTKRYIWLNVNGYGKYIAAVGKVKGKVKTFIKDKILSK